jgi:hypothetical protein
LAISCKNSSRVLEQQNTFVKVFNRNANQSTIIDPNQMEGNLPATNNSHG